MYIFPEKTEGKRTANGLSCLEGIVVVFSLVEKPGNSARKMKRGYRINSEKAPSSHNVSGICILLLFQFLGGNEIENDQRNPSGDKHAGNVD